MMMNESCDLLRGSKVHNRISTTLNSTFWTHR